MAYQDSAAGITSGVLAVGASLCIGVTAGPRVSSMTLQFLSGGTAMITGISIVVGVIPGYHLAPSIPLVIPGPASFNLNSVNGVTSIVQIIKYLNPAPATF